MSAINDALKRAKQALEKQSAMSPRDNAPAANDTRVPFPWAWATFAVLLLAGAGAFIAMAMIKRPAPQPPLQQSSPVVAPLAAAVVVTQKVEAPTPQPMTQVVAQITAPETTNSPATAATPAVAAAPQSQPSPAPVPKPKVATPPVTKPGPVLKLQGIFYDPKQSSAIINGRSVSVGNTIAGYRVTAISRTSVTLVSTDGRQQVLSPKSK